MDAETRPSPALFGTALFSGNKLLPAARSGFGGASGYAEFACLGYKRGDDRELVIDEPDAESVRKSFEIRASGCSLGAILKWLYKTKSFHQRENSKVGACSSSEIPTTVPFPASPKTALWWEFLRFPPRFAGLAADGGRGCEGRLRKIDFDRLLQTKSPLSMP